MTEKRLNKRRLYCLSLWGYSIYGRLQMVLSNPKLAKLATKGHCYKSLTELLMQGYSHTFKWRRHHGEWVARDWTSEVTDVLRHLNIPFIIDNDAPREGANGQIVMIDDIEYLNSIAHLKLKEP